MAIDLKLRFLQVNYGTDTIYLEDFTGLYNVVTNTTGYGNSVADPNPCKDVADAEINDWGLNVTRPDATTFSLTTATLEGLNSAKFYEVVQIPVVDTQDLIDGLWTFEYIVNEAGGPLDTVTLTYYIVNLAAIQNSINAKIAADIDFCDFPSCGCNKNLLTLWSYYRALEAAIDEQNGPQVTYLLAEINKLV